MRANPVDVHDAGIGGHVPERKGASRLDHARDQPVPRSDLPRVVGVGLPDAGVRLERERPGRLVAQPDPDDVDAGQRARDPGEPVEQLLEVERRGEQTARLEQAFLLRQERVDAPLHAADDADGVEVRDQRDGATDDRGEQEQPGADGGERLLRHRDLDDPDVTVVGGRRVSQRSAELRPPGRWREAFVHAQDGARRVEHPHANDRRISRDVAQDLIERARPELDDDLLRMASRVSLERRVLQHEVGHRKAEADDDAGRHRERTQPPAETRSESRALGSYRARSRGHDEWIVSPPRRSTLLVTLIRWLEGLMRHAGGRARSDDPRMDERIAEFLSSGAGDAPPGSARRAAPWR